MILNRIKINRFGKLHDEKVEFMDGFNIVYGPNESGKSTLYGFIAAMLFGMNRSRGKASKTDDFTRFEPKEAPFEYSGRIEFESGGKEYILSRQTKREKGNIIRNYTKNARTVLLLPIWQSINSLVLLMKQYSMNS